MDSRNIQLPEDAVEAIEAGNLLEAVKITRERTGADLMEAKAAVDAYAKGASPRAAMSGRVAPGTIPPEAMASIDAGDLLAAVRITVQTTGIGLKDAKDLIDRYLAENPSIRERFNAAAAERRSMFLRMVIGIAAIGLAVYVCLRWLGIV